MKENSSSLINEREIWNIIQNHIRRYRHWCICQRCIVFLERERERKDKKVRSRAYVITRRSSTGISRIEDVISVVLRRAFVTRGGAGSLRGTCDEGEYRTTEEEKQSKNGMKQHGA
jgi:hypothetical protein